MTQTNKSTKIVHWKPVIGRKLTTIKQLSPNKKKTLQKKHKSLHASFEAVGHIDKTDSDPTSKRATRGYANFDIDEDKQIQFSGSGWRVERAGAVLYHQHRISPLTLQNF